MHYYLLQPHYECLIHLDAENQSLSHFISRALASAVSEVFYWFNFTLSGAFSTTLLQVCTDTLWIGEGVTAEQKLGYLLGYVLRTRWQIGDRCPAH
jgi:recombinational DNA repair protein RecR